MNRFTLYRNEDGSSKKTYPYFIDVQDSLPDDLNSRLVIPLSPHRALDNTEAKKLCPVIPIGGENFALLTHQITPIPKSILKTKVTSLESLRYGSLDAIDMPILSV
jgi:toxin CcdB